MNIPFRRINKSPREFEVTFGSITLKGTLVHKERNLVTLKAQMSGALTLPCDGCAEVFEKSVNEELDLIICDGLYESSDDLLDIIEMNDSIDMNELLCSEIELMKSDYHSCPTCKTQERN